MAKQTPLKSRVRKESGAVYARVLICFAVCAIALFVTLIAYALSPGNDLQVTGHEQAQATFGQSGAPAIAPENAFQGQVVSITETPLLDVAPYDVAVLAGNNPIPLSLVAPVSRATESVAVESRPAPVFLTEPTATPAGSTVLLDTFTGRTVTFTGSVPHTYMGDGFTNNTIPGSTTYVSLRSYTFYMIASAVANYTDVHARLALWNGYAAGTSPVFSNNSAFFDVDLGALNVTTAPVFFAITVMVSPPYPFLAGGPGTAWGYSQNFQGSTTGGVMMDDTNLTSTICYGAPYAAGQILTGTSLNFGYYRNASGETDFNFLSSDSRTLVSGTSQGVAIIIHGDPTTGPTPTIAPSTPIPIASPTPSPTPTPTITPPPPVCNNIITLSSSQAIVTGNSVSCNNGVGHTDNSYWRAFNMNGFTGGLAYNVASVSFGIESASSNVPESGTPTPTLGAAPQLVTVRLYTQNPGPVFPGGTRSLIATTTVNVPDQTATIFTTPLVVTVPAGTSQLIMEVFTPDGETTAGNLFLIGSNSAPQGGPSYISARDCSIPTPMDVVNIGFPDMHIVMNVSSCVMETPVPTITISGNAFNCSAPAPTATPPASPSPPPLVPVPSVLMVLSGSSTGTTLTNGSGNYSFDGLAGGGTYTVTPSKGPLVPGSVEINTVDVLAIQRHFLALAVIPAGCRLNAADTVNNGTVNTQDVLAVQRFFLGLTSGTGSSGQYHFTPGNRSYPSLGMLQTNQDYAMYVIGDVVAQFANRPEPGPTSPNQP